MQASSSDTTKHGQRRDNAASPGSTVACPTQADDDFVHVLASAQAAARGTTISLLVSRIGKVRSVTGGLARAVVLAAALTFSPFVQAEPIRGAGSTFAAPVIAKWAKAYQDARTDGGEFVSPDWTVDYELVGSLGGLMRLEQPELDFAATDVPVTPAELAKHGRQQFPIVMGGVAIVANLDGCPLSRQALCVFRARFWRISISARSSPGPIPPSRRSIPTSTFPISGSWCFTARTAPARPSSSRNIFRRSAPNGRQNMAPTR